ncbi:MAG: 4a-hydroxytetrahydrobiopterin dehydratase [Patescibacteria group bacterium]
MTDEPLPSYWTYTEDRTRILRTFKTLDFKSAFETVQKVAVVAEECGHHPEIRFGWGFVEVVTWTHSTNTVTEKDIALAKSINEHV